MFDGATYEPLHDQTRLTGQFERVRDLMADGQWRTLEQIQQAAGPGTLQGISARLRDLRKPRFGSHNVQRRRVTGGLFEYRIASLLTEDMDGREHSALSR